MITDAGIERHKGLRLRNHHAVSALLQSNDVAIFHELDLHLVLLIEKPACQRNSGIGIQHQICFDGAVAASGKWRTNLRFARGRTNERSTLNAPSALLHGPIGY